MASINLRPKENRRAKVAAGGPLPWGGGGGLALVALFAVLLALFNGQVRERVSEIISLGERSYSAPSISELAAARPYFNPPASMRFRVGAEVTLFLTPEYIASQHPSSGASTARALISEEMTAVLHGQGATVVPMTPERIGVRMDQVALWRWRVTPMSTTQVVLEPVASAILANQASGAAPYVVYREQALVRVDTAFWDGPKWFVYDHWGTILTILGSLFGGGFLLKLFSSFRKPGRPRRAGF